MKELVVYKYDGFWHCMDTIRDIEIVNEILKSKNGEKNLNNWF